MSAASGTGVAGRISYIGNNPVRFTSKRAGDRRVWSWRSVDDPRQFGNGFPSRAEAEIAAWKALVKFDNNLN